MSQSSRRTFLMSTGAAVAAASTARAWAQSPASKVVVGLIGPGGMGTNHLRQLASRTDVEVAAVCDVDANRLAAAVKEVQDRSGKAPRAERDLRKLLDDPRIDAVFIATPDHWHAPAAILALDAGKHVYVEKPCCHNIAEGRAMAKAVERSGKLLQVGTQSRSGAAIQEAIDRLRAGEIGEVLVAKAWNSQRRGSIGKSKPTDPPAQLDFDLWTGPAPVVPYRTNLLHGVWRWWYAFGCGDIGNDGVHDIDVAAWGLGIDDKPTTVSCLGGKYFFDDDQQFPDTQYAVCEYATGGRPKQLIFEQRIWSPYRQEEYENGAAFYGTKGLLLMGHTVGWRLYGERNRLIVEKSGGADLPAHHSNFFDCIRGSQKRLNADIQAGNIAATVVHLANISARVGRNLKYDGAAAVIRDDQEANSLVHREYREHWSKPRDV